MITEIKEQISKLTPGQANDHSFEYCFAVQSNADNYNKGKQFTGSLFLPYESTEIKLMISGLFINYKYPMHGDIAQTMLTNFGLYLSERFNVELIIDNQ